VPEGDAPRRRTRRSPEVSEREILDAAAALLADVPFRDLSVDELMRRTRMGRSSFYVYFRDRGDLALRLLARIEGEMFAVAERWLAGRGDPVADVREALEGVAAVYARHGRVLAAIAEAGHHDAAVEQAYRWGLVERFVRAVAARIRRDRAAGLTDVGDPDEVARALLLLNERYLTELLGGPDPAPTAAVVEVLQLVWVRTLYPGRR
jgi:TetR/AcrR family transcriptional regulator, ethionamide resistance regulator